MPAWPMYVERAFALTPAAIISDAKVCRHSCSVIGSSGGPHDPDGTNSPWSSSCQPHALRVRSRIDVSLNGRSAVTPNTSPSVQARLSRCSSRWSRRIAGIGTRRSLPDFVAISPSTASQPRRTWITPAVRSTSSRRSAISSPRRSPAYIAVAHSARSAGRSAASSSAHSSGEAIRSRPPLTAGICRSLVGFTAIPVSGRASAPL